MVDPEATTPTDPLGICRSKLEQSRLAAEIDEQFCWLGDPETGAETGIFINDFEDDTGYFYIVAGIRSDQVTALSFIVGEFAFPREEVARDRRAVKHRFMLVLEDGRVIDYPTDPGAQYYEVIGDDIMRPLMPSPDLVRKEIDQFLDQYEELAAIDTLDLFSRLAVSIPHKVEDIG